MGNPLVLSVVLALAVFFTSTRGQGNFQPAGNEYFITPPANNGESEDAADNPFYNMGSTVALNWTTTWPSIYLGIYKGVMNQNNDVSSIPEIHYWPDSFSDTSNVGIRWNFGTDGSRLEPPFATDLQNGNGMYRVAKRSDLYRSALLTAQQLSASL